jgi:hypothetical protein
MSAKLLIFADGLLTLGGEELPGILSSLRIDGKARYDEQKVDGASGKSKTPLGWEDQAVTATLILTTDDVSDCYEKLERLSSFFRQPDAAANPQVYSLVNRQAGARGLRDVILDRLESTECNSSDTISAVLGFTEHRPPIIRTEEGAAKSPTPGEAGAEAGAAEPEESQDIDIG